MVLPDANVLPEQKVIVDPPAIEPLCPYVMFTSTITFFSVTEKAALLSLVQLFKPEGLKCAFPVSGPIIR
jgi:hypothetical protein